ncbi:MAG: ABC transporter substrate-binding protein [Burkholderiales bacterium]
MSTRNASRWARPLAWMAAFGVAAASWLAMIPVALGQGKSFTVGYFPTWVGAWPVIVAKKKGLYGKHLPAGTTVNWDLQVVGPPIVNNMLAGKTDIGYFADFPAIVASTKRDIQDIRVVATNSWSAGQLCRVILVRSDAPQFDSPRDALKWLNGKTVALTKGTCMDRFWSFLEEKEGIKAEIVYQSPEVIATNLRAKKVDAGLLFQAHIAQVATRGIARVAVTGTAWNLPDGAFIVMRKQFIDSQRAAAKGFLKAEIEALRFMAAQPEETIGIVAEEVPGFTKRELWNALYARMPATAGATDVNFIAKLAIDDEVRRVMNDGVKFLHARKVVNIDTLPDGTLYDELINEIMREMGITAPLLTIKALPVNPFKD